MQTVGEILENKRLEQNFLFDQVEKVIKIRTKYLEGIEKNDFSKIPGGAPVIKGFIKNYAEFLGLSSSSLLAVFRRDFQESKTGQIIPRGMVEPLDKSQFTWTPRLTIISTLIVLFLAFGIYLFSQYSSLFFAPRLEIIAPKEGELFKQNFVEVKGQTDPDATIFLNQEAKLLAPDGSFSEKIPLTPGENKILIEVVNRKGKKTQAVRQIRYEP